MWWIENHFQLWILDKTKQLSLETLPPLQYYSRAICLNSVYGIDLITLAMSHVVGYIFADSDSNSSDRR